MKSKFGNKALRVNISRHQTDSSIIKIISFFPNPMSLSMSLWKSSWKPLAGSSNEDILTALHYSELTMNCFTEALNGLSK